MRSFIAALAFFALLGCGNRENKTASPGTLPSASQTGDTSGLITDSVVIRDSNTTDIEAMKKIN